MKRSIEVHLGEKAQRVGTLNYNQDGNRERSAFEQMIAAIRLIYGAVKAIH